MCRNLKEPFSKGALFGRCCSGGIRFSRFHLILFGFSDWIWFDLIAAAAMLLPWKKVKSARISQLVNDHLHISQKRRDGSSLVVETGFPTSLIDLFFKNREKLKKPSKKKRRGRPITPSDDTYDPTIVGSPISFPSPPPPPPSLVGSPVQQRHSSILPPPPSCVDEIYVAGSSGSDGGGAVEEQRCPGIGGGADNEVLYGVMKVFVVAVLALATKRLTVGITISAMVLLFLEYVAKHRRLLSTPCAAAISTVRRCVRLVRYEESELHPPSRVSDQEIEAVESTVGVDEIQPEKESVGYPETELLEMAMKSEESMRRKSKKARIKSKMQKLVPNKFRRSRKDQEFQTPAAIKDEEVDQSEIGEESSSSSVSNRSYREECRLSDANEEADTKIEAASARTYMLLCLIVLVGLIGGRPIALILTLSWFLLLKIGQKLVPRSIKLLIS